MTGGSGTAALGLGRPAAGKTGTATNGKGEVSSAWFVGYTPQLSTAVMYVRGKGNEELQGWLPEYFGGAYPADTWLAVMSDLMEGLEVEEFPEPVFVDGEAPPGYAPTTAPPAPAEPAAHAAVADPAALAHQGAEPRPRSRPRPRRRRRPTRRRPARSSSGPRYARRRGQPALRAVVVRPAGAAAGAAGPSPSG